MNIRLKLIIFCLTISFGVGLSLWLFFRYESEQTMEKLVSESYTRQSMHILNGLDRFVYERLQSIRNIANDPILSNPVSTTQQIQMRLNELQKINPLNKSFSFFNKDRIRIADSQHLSIGIQHSFSNYWKELEKGNQYTMDISRSEALGKLVMHFAAIVHDKNGNKIGTVVSRMLLSRMHEILEISQNDTQNQDKKTRIDLVDNEGLLLYSSHQPEAVLEVCFYLNHYMNDVKKHSNHNYYESNDTLHFVIEQEGYLDYKGAKWKLITSVPHQEAYALIRSTQQKLYRVAMPLLIITILATLYFAVRFTKPIRVLNEAVKKIGSGNLDTKIHVTTNDEIGLLAKSFQQMTLKLKKRIEKQNVLNAELNTMNKKYEVQIHEINTQKEEIQEQKAKLSKVYNEVEQKNSAITASIIYAERIQKAMSPEGKVLAQNFPESFILDMPRDIVSGDFYWFDDLEVHHEKYFVVAAVDCTGHGVPGSFMSILGRNILTSIVSEEKEISPKIILELLNQRIKKVLHQDSYATNNRDGMDVALCVFHKTKQKLYFAGAHRPLYLLREDKLTIVKGNSFSLGGSTPKFRKKREITVTEHELDVKANDLYYIFSDGFKDQYNQINNKMFSGRRFRSTIMHIKDEPLNIQRNLLEGKLLDWKGDGKQTDDILVVGMKVTENCLNT